MNKLEELYDQYCTLANKRNIDGNSKEALEAVKQNGYALAYISNPSEQVCLEAVKRNGDALAYINNPSEQVCLEAVKQDGYALKYIPSHMFDSMISSLPDSLKLLSPSKTIRELAEKNNKECI